MSSGQEPRSVRRETLPGENVGYQSQGEDGEMTETWGGGWVKIWPLETIKMAEMATRIFISVYDDIWMKVASWTTNGFLWTDAKLLYSVVALHKDWETLYEFLSRINCSCWLIWCESTVSLLRLSLKLAIASVNQKFSVAGRRFSLLWRGPGTEKLLFIFFWENQVHIYDDSFRPSASVWAWHRIVWFWCLRGNSNVKCESPRSVQTVFGELQIHIIRMFEEKGSFVGNGNVQTCTLS